MWLSTIEETYCRELWSGDQSSPLPEQGLSLFGEAQDQVVEPEAMQPLKRVLIGELRLEAGSPVDPSP